MFRQVCDTSERVKKEVLDTPSIHGTKVLTNKKIEETSFIDISSFQIFSAV